MNTPHRFPLPHAIVFAAFMVPSFVAALWLGNLEFLFYAIVTALLGGLLFVIHRRVGFSNGVLWLLVIWAALHMNGGLVPVPDFLPAKEPRVFYNLWFIPGYFKYDNLVHAFGFFTTALAAWEGIRSMHPAARPTLGWLLIVWTSSQGFGALNEVVEFAAVLAVEETNVGDFDNAMWDLVANMAGALLACILIRVKTENVRLPAPPSP